MLLTTTRLFFSFTHIRTVTLFARHRCGQFRKVEQDGYSFRW
jgi:hypothetical protein